MEACRICNNCEGNTRYEVREMMFGSLDSFNYIKCAQCGCLQIETIPEKISNYYPKDYYSFGKLDESKYSGIKGKFRLLGLKRKLAYLQHPQSNKFNMYHALGKLKVHKENSILDIGGGNGSFLYPLSKIGFTTLLSVDPYIDNTIEYLSGHTAKKADITQIQGLWDYILFCHSFEHIWSLDETMENVNRLLNEQGYCLIAIPVVDSEAWETYKTCWYQIDAPRHFYLHSKESMSILAKRHGFEIVDIIHNSNYQQYFVSELYTKGVRLLDIVKFKGNKLLWKLKKHILIKKTLEANKAGKGDQAIFVLKKNS